MKKRIILTAFVAFTIMFGNAQNFSLQAKSGDVELDASLNDINIKAKADISLFKNTKAAETKNTEMAMAMVTVKERKNNS